MKFILNENEKFILTERFILNEDHFLTEASVIDVASKWASYLEKNLETSETVLTNFKSLAGMSANDHKKLSNNTDLIKQLEETGENIKNSLNMPLAEINLNLSDIKVEITDYLTAVSTIIGLLDSAKDDDIINLLSNGNTKITTISNKTTLVNADINQLKTWIDKIEAKSLQKLNSSALDTKVKQIQELKEYCNKCLDLINKIKLLPKIDFKSCTEMSIKEYIECIQNIDSKANFEKQLKVNKGNIIANIDTYNKKVQAAYQLYTNFLNLTIMKRKEYDWTSRYNAAVDKEAIVEAFIYDTWPANAKKVLNIKKAIEQECINYGFKSSNPFMSFISEVYLKYNISADAYNIVHNQVANGVISIHDLKADDKEARIGAANLIFCKAFYELDSANMKLYLAKQRALSRITNIPDIFTSNKELIFNILYKNSNIVSGSNLISTNKELNSFPVIEALEQKFIGNVTDTSISEIEDKSKQKATVSAASLIKQIGTTDNAVKVLAALAIKFSSNTTLAGLVNNCAKVVAFMNATTTWSDVQKLVLQVDRIYKLETINSTQALYIVRSILASDEFDL